METDCMNMLRKKATIHQVTTMLATSKNVLIPGHIHLLTTGTDDPTLRLSPECQRVISTGTGVNQSVRSSVPVISKVVMTWK